MKCIQQVSAHGENMQPHPKRVADVMTKLLFACYTNHYTTSEAKALPAVVAVRSKLHRMRVMQLLRGKTQHQGLAVAASHGGFWASAAKGTQQQEWAAKAASRTLGQFLSQLPAKDEAELRDVVLVTQPPAHWVILGCWGVHRGLFGLLVSRMSMEIILTTWYWVWPFQAPLSNTPKKVRVWALILTKGFSCL